MSTVLQNSNKYSHEEKTQENNQNALWIIMHFLWRHSNLKRIKKSRRKIETIKLFTVHFRWQQNLAKNAYTLHTHQRQDLNSKCIEWIAIYQICNFCSSFWRRRWYLQQRERLDWLSVCMRRASVQHFVAVLLLFSRITSYRLRIFRLKY